MRRVETIAVAHNSCHSHAIVLADSLAMSFCTPSQRSTSGST